MWSSLLFPFAVSFLSAVAVVVGAVAVVGDVAVVIVIAGSAASCFVFVLVM